MRVTEPSKNCQRIVNLKGRFALDWTEFLPKIAPDLVGKNPSRSIPCFVYPQFSPAISTSGNR
jgi:hypothetical protein